MTWSTQVLYQLTNQVVRCRRGDLHSGKTTRCQKFGAGKMHQLVLTGTACRHFTIALTESFDEDMLDAANSQLMLTQRASLQNCLEFLKPLRNYFLWNKICIQVPRFSSFTRRELE